MTRSALVYTSAGDRANVGQWLRGPRNFDLWVTYYGTGHSPYVELAEYHNARPGGKFPNLLHVFREHREIFSRYDSIAVFDDDLVIEAGDISRLFEIREQHGLSLLQPAFDPRGRVSFEITKARPWSVLRFVNFVEVTCPVFDREVLEAFLEVYDPVLVGWGIDCWFSDMVGSVESRTMAVVDAVVCLNPWTRSEGIREIDTLQAQDVRKATWEAMQRKLGIPDRPKVTSAPIRRGLRLKDLLASARLQLMYAKRAMGNWLRARGLLAPD